MEGMIELPLLENGMIEAFLSRQEVGIRMIYITSFQKSMVEPMISGISHQWIETFMGK